MKRISTRPSASRAVAATAAGAARFRAAVLSVAGLLAVAGVLAVTVATAQSRAPDAAAASAPAAAPSTAPGWTGRVHAEDVIAARRALMLELQSLMRPIDSHAAGEPADPDELRAAARTISAMLAAVPHLFPPTTNLYDPQAEMPATLALPAIWESFPAFYSLASAAASAATEMTETQAPADLPAAARALRGACDACHAPYMRQYAAPEVSSEDLEFDFDSLFEAE